MARAKRGSPAALRGAAWLGWLAWLLQAALLGAPLAAHAQFPARPVTLVVPFPPGATTDTIARILAQHASAGLGRSVVIENKPGAEGQLAAQDVAKSPPDGYRLTLATAGNLSALPAMRRNPPYDPVADFTPVADVGRYQFFVYTHPSLPVRSFRELVEHARANPGRLSYGTGNNTGVLAMAAFRSAHGLDMTHVPYKGEPPAIADLVAGRVQAMVATGIGIPHAKEGRLRMLAALLPQRSPLAPEVPTLRETGQKELDAVLWAGVVGPAGLPTDALERLHREFNAALAHPEAVAAIEKLGFTLTPGKAEAFGALIREQVAVFRRLVREAGLPVE